MTLFGILLDSSFVVFHRNAIATMIINIFVMYPQEAIHLSEINIS